MTKRTVEERLSACPDSLRGCPPLSDHGTNPRERRLPAGRAAGVPAGRDPVGRRRPADLSFHSPPPPEGRLEGDAPRQEPMR